jgi:hypothetical protein
MSTPQEIRDALTLEQTIEWVRSDFSRLYRVDPANLTLAQNLQIQQVAVGILAMMNRDNEDAF